uniref:albumin-binding GA domain-containing protein n=1 Tax=Anaerococcus sp. AGMB09787 TaxID=2922869 RepID=UPI001FAF3F57
MDKYLELIKQKKEKSSNRKPKYATRKLSIGLVSCMLGFLIFSSEPVAFAEEEPAANITDESAETPEEFEEKNLGSGEENEKSENLNTGVTGPETTPVPTVSTDTVETTTEEADNIYLAKSKEIAIAKINELGLGDKATEFIDRVNDANDFDTLEAIVEEAKKASEEKLAEPTDTGDQSLSDTPDEKEVIGKIVVYERKENGKIERLTSEEIEQTNIDLSQSGVELEKTIEAQNWFSFVSEKSENNQYEYSITTNTGYHIVMEDVELPPSLATYAKQITTNNGTLTLMEGTQTYFLVVEKDKAPYEESIGDIPDNLDYQKEYAEKLEASRNLEETEEYIVRYVLRDKDGKELKELQTETWTNWEAMEQASVATANTFKETYGNFDVEATDKGLTYVYTEEDKAPYEGSIGDIPDNLDYQSEYAEKLEATRKLEAAKEEAKKALDEAGIESDYFDKYIDSAKTIEGLEAYVKEVIASHEATEADKAPYEGSVGDIPENLDYQSEYAEKLEASRKLEEAKEKAKKALKAAGIESDFYAKYIDKANTIEGIEAYVKEVIGAHTDSVVTSAEEDDF